MGNSWIKASSFQSSDILPSNPGFWMQFSFYQWGAWTHTSVHSHWPPVSLPSQPASGHRQKCYTVPTFSQPQGSASIWSQKGRTLLFSQHFQQVVSIYVPILNPFLAEAFKEWFLLVAINTVFHTLSSIFRKKTVHCNETLGLGLLIHFPSYLFLHHFRVWITT